MRDRNDRDAPCLKKEELIRIVKWKITRGKTRPLLHVRMCIINMIGMRENACL